MAYAKSGVFDTFQRQIDFTTGEVACQHKISMRKNAAATLYFHNIAAAFLRLGFGVPTTPHRFVRLLFGKTSQNWCSCGVVGTPNPKNKGTAAMLCKCNVAADFLYRDFMLTGNFSCG